MLSNDQKVAGAFERARDIPYRLALSTDDPNCSCVGKHQQFREEVEKMGYHMRWVEVAFRWSDLPIPHAILALPHNDDTTHAYLEILSDGQWLTVDLTWDKGLAHALPVNGWDDFGSMKIAVPVLRRIPEAEMWINRKIPDQELEDELNHNREFFTAVNRWLERCREEGDF